MKTPTFPKSPVTLAVAAALCGSPTFVQAAEETRLGTIAVIEEEDGALPAQVSSPKYTAPLTDTPQSITVVTQETIAEQNLLSLRDILSTVPGITFGAGEGGGGYGDSINLRGFAGSNDVTVDGFRDSAQYTRSDPFNLEQVEVVNGANSVYSGAGSVGGTVNLVSKSARLGDSSRVSFGGGSDEYTRATGDFNHQIGQTSAVRLNVMGHRSQVPDREVERNKRWGIAPSISYGLGTTTTLSLALLHQHDDNTPQYGVPTWEGNLLPGVDRESYFGYSNVDQQINDTDAATFTLSHVFNDTLSIRNQTRWQQTDQLSVVDPPQGTFCLANGTSPTNTGVTACPAGYLPDQFQPSGPRGTTRDTRNQLLSTQNDLTATFNTGGAEHTLVAGFALTSESYSLKNGNSQRQTGGALPNPVLPRTSISNPDYRGYTGPVNFIVASTTDGDLDNRALYVFDNIRFSERWSLNGGVRVEHNQDRFTTVTYATPATGGAATPAVPGSNSDNLVSYRAGLVYKPTTASSVYLAYGNSQTPSVASVNGTCTVGGANNNCNLDPEKAENIELGTKWDALEGRLSLTAALSRNNRSNYRVNEGITPENPTGSQVLDGRARVDALLLGAAGRILPNWSVFTNYTLLDSKVLQGTADSISAAGQDFTRGDPLLNVPRHAASLWTTWDVRRGLQLGYGLTWQGRVFVSQHTAASGVFPAGSALPTAGGYVVHRATASYTVSRRLQLQVNVNNLFDKQYLTRVRTQRLAWATPGEARSVVLSANLSF
jgi:catecholate siderophore receptor